MKILVFAVAALVAATAARPDGIYPSNVVTVPPNCPPGQEWINGKCREIWILANAQSDDESISPQNTIVVPPNCGPGQKLINGVCRDIWRLKEAQQLSEITNPEQSKLWSSLFNMLKSMEERLKRQTEENESTVEEFGVKNIITVPNQCPAGYRPDALGYCREIFV
ncbi:unnamed protein product [Diatraea saccharalis]|uniref:Uncharacterized protein n=1 Tax=Diatraea saccharalis TaxID=40085 RepID=A0A9N9QUW3_9NEOP|nr:unnamed protein product [Diatraea saccharalis]